MGYKDFFDATKNGTISVNQGAHTVTFTTEELYKSFFYRLKEDLKKIEKTNRKCYWENEKEKSNGEF